MSAGATAADRSYMHQVSPKGASVEDEADVFEITDFTTASEWERFIARLEEILHEWKLVNIEPRPPAMRDQYATGTWAEKTEEVVFADFRFTFSYLYLTTNEPSSAGPTSSKKEESDDVDEEHKTPTVFLDLMNFENDFPSRAHYLCRWYGLQEFFTLIPLSERQMIDSESRAKLLLSSAAIALGNSNCSIPVFVQLNQKWRKLFTGSALVRGASIEFEMSQLKRFPSQFSHLAGLLEVFKSKLGCAYISMPPVSVAVRFTYKLEDWIESAWPQSPPDFSSICDGEVGYGDIDILPFGACTDPISQLHLSCTWPCLSEDMIVENSLYSDLDPLQAPQWTVRLQMIDDPQCLLGAFLQDFLKLCNRHESTDEVLSKAMVETDANKDKQTGELSQALQRLTEPVPSLTSIPTISTMMSSASARIRLHPEDAPIPDSLLDKILYFLFPDAKLPKSPGNSSKHSKQDSRKASVTSAASSLPSPVSDTTVLDDTEVPSTKAVQEKVSEVLSDLNKQLKSAPMDSLTQKLALALGQVNHNFGGLLGVAHLWQEFILEMRFRWENKHLLCNLEKGAPNMGSCILHQKLQMLNCCIECKIKRESAGYGYGPDSISVHDRSFDSSASYDDKDGADGLSNISRVASIVSSSDDDEEFFDADDVESGQANEQGDNVDGEVDFSANADTDGAAQSSLKPKSDLKSKNRRSVYVDSLTHRPEGRLVPMKNEYLLVTGEQLFIPVTQEPSPMTEDMLEEHAEVLAKLGSSAEGSQIRARMQSACLVSDMESFKAANPGCILEDFVRWYSPRDYVVDDVDEDGEEEVSEQASQGSASSKGSTTKRGRLSQRMQIPGNMWVEAWQSAKPVPARRQKRLFDDTKEAEKVLHYLASLKPAEVILHLMPCMIHASIAKLTEEAVKTSVPNFKPMVDTVVARAAKVTRNFPLDRKKYEDLLRMIELAETVSARTTSLCSKFSSDHLLCPEQEGKEAEIESFVTSLLTQAEVPVRGGACGPAGAIIHKMFITAQKSNNMILDEEGFEYNTVPTTSTLDIAGVGRKSPPNATNLSSPSSETKSPSVPDFPAPSVREYILRAMVPRPAPYSKVLPQRMYCFLTEGDNRIAGAFTSDSTFQ